MSDRNDAISDKPPKHQPRELHVHIHEGEELSKFESLTRIGCGALLGGVLGSALAIRLALSSYGVIGALIALAICLCAFLALKYGDRFWSGLFNLPWW